MHTKLHLQTYICMYVYIYIYIYNRLRKGAGNLCTHWAVMPHLGLTEDLVMSGVANVTEGVTPHLGPRGYCVRATVPLTIGDRLK